VPFPCRRKKVSPFHSRSSSFFNFYTCSGRSAGRSFSRSGWLPWSQERLSDEFNFTLSLHHRPVIWDFDTPFHDFLCVRLSSLLAPLFVSLGSIVLSVLLSYINHFQSPFSFFCGCEQKVRFFLDTLSYPLSISPLFVSPDQTISAPDTIFSKRRAGPFPPPSSPGKTRFFPFRSFDRRSW